MHLAVSLALAVLAGLAPRPALALPLISELFYDAVGSDNGHSFVELYGAPGASLEGLVLEGVNGAGGAIGPTIVLSGAIPADGFFVVADDQGDGTTLVAEADLLSNFDFQNGPRKAQGFHVLAERGDTAAGWVCHMGVYKRGSIWYARWFEDGRDTRLSEVHTGSRRWSRRRCECRSGWDRPWCVRARRRPACP